MNSSFVGYEELSRSPRVLSAEMDNTLLLGVIHLLLNKIRT